MNIGKILIKKDFEEFILSKSLDNITPNQNEVEFVNLLNIEKIKYKFQYYNTEKHPEFDELFPYNKVSGSKFVSPYHKWDFKISTVDKDILVDIDGRDP